tara:strand:- start:753 stop:1427 length:675 start_codon:yes stop_codon:yes gene_type:complete
VTEKTDFPRIGPMATPMAFVSDIHGNLQALDAVLGVLRRREITTVIACGDHLLGGPDPLGVWRRLQEIEARCCRGVSDRAVAIVDPSALTPRNAQDEARLEAFRQTQETVGELVRKQLSQLPESIRIPMIDGREVVAVHGSPADPTVEMSHDLSDDELEARIDDDPADIIVCGGTHVPFRRDVHEWAVINVGSVGQAPEGRNAHFTVLSPRMDGIEVHQDFVEY